MQWSILTALLLSMPVTQVSAQSPTKPGDSNQPAAAKSSGDTAKAKSDEQQEKRAAEWVQSLELTDPAKIARLKEVIATHLKTVRDWHNEHPPTTVPAGINPVTGKRLSDLDRQV